MDFAVRRRTLDDDLGLLEVRGELDVETVDVCEACARALLEEVHHVVVDLTRTTLLDCRGLATLLSVRRSACARGGSLRTAGARPAVRLVFDAFGAGDVLGGEAPVEEELRRATARATTPREVDLRAAPVDAGRG